MAFLVCLRVPMRPRFMTVPNALTALAWGLAWIRLMFAEISGAKKNVDCWAMSGDRRVEGEIFRFCWQGDWLDWYPNNAATVVTFFVGT